MTGPSGITIRPPAVAGMFYPQAPDECRSAAAAYMSSARPDASRTWRGGLAPHAGWICSAAIAAQTIASLRAGGEVDVVVVFAAVHTPLPLDRAALDTHTLWRLPSGDAAVATELAAVLARETDLFCVDARFHAREHAAEVEVPLIQAAWPGAAILPIAVAATDRATEIGQATAAAVRDKGLKAVYLASSDLTHYGPNYNFTPAGVGHKALAWARENDRRLLRIVTELRVDAIVPEAKASESACGPGAIAAMVAACRSAGATSATLLAHANSYETLASIAPHSPDNAVGYAAIVVG